MIQVDDNDDIRTLVLQPNRSMTWNDNVQVIIGLACATLFVPTVWALRGMWLPLPIAIVELLCLAAGFYYVCWKLTFKQVIRIAPDSLSIAAGHYRPTGNWQFDRTRAALALEQRKHPWDAPRITLYDRQHRVAIGRFLNKEDTQVLLQLLVESGIRIRSSGTPRKLEF
jgi:uncharacterized membrane protein